MSRRFMPPQVRDEIRQRVDIVELVSAHAALRKSGRYYKGLCPFHQEKTPSFHVDRERGLFHCFGCGAGGDIFDFVMRTTGMSFPEAAQELAQRAGVRFVPSPEAVQQSSERQQLLRALDAAREHFRRMLASSQGEQARAYLARRGVSDEVANRFQLGYAPPGWEGLLAALRSRGYPPALLEQAGLLAARAEGEGYYDVFRDRLIFPITDLQDRAIAFGGRALDGSEPKYLNSRETPLFTKGRTLYALAWARDAIRDAGEVLVVEGYMDALACHQFGFRQAVASLGTALTAEQVALLRRFAARVVLLYDADQAGAAAAERALALCEGADLPVRVAVLPAGQDPDAFLRTQGPEAFGRLMAAALPAFEYRLDAAARRHDPTSREGKIALIDEVLNVLQVIPNPVRTAEYLRSLAERFAIPEEALQQRLRARRRGGRSYAPEAGAPALRSDRARLEAERLLLHLMVQEPERRAPLADRLGPDAFAFPVHRALAEALMADPRGDVGATRANLEGEAAALLVRLAFEAPPVTERDKEQAFADAVRYLVLVEPAVVERRRVWEAIQRAQAAGDEAELRRLQALYADLVVTSRRTR